MKRILAIVCLLAASASAQEWAWPVLARQASKRSAARPYVGALTTNYPGIVFLASFESNWVDSVSGRTGSIGGGMVFTNGVYASASHNAGAGGYVDFNIGSTFPASLYAYSVSAWMYPISTNLALATVAHALIGANQIAYWGWGNTVTAGTQRINSMFYRTVTTANDNTRFGSTAANTLDASSTNKWTHLLWVFDPHSAPPNVRTYIDGVYVPIDSGFNPTLTNLVPTRIILRGVGSSGMSGRLDDFAIFNRALTAEEAAAIAARE
jgi:hypothetical protein